MIYRLLIAISFIAFSTSFCGEYNDWYHENEIIHLPYNEDLDENGNECDEDGNPIIPTEPSTKTKENETPTQSENSKKKFSLNANYSTYYSPETSSSTLNTEPTGSTSTASSQQSFSTTFFKEGAANGVVDGVDVVSGFYTQSYQDHEIAGPIHLSVDRS